MASRRDIDPDGDITLVLGPIRLGSDAEVNDDSSEGSVKNLQSDELRVSSKILKLNSPVFKAMLGGKFREGAELAGKTDHSEPYIVDLPDDDVEAMTILCQILHNVYIPERPSPLCLERLAFVCDKYECMEALKYCGMVWVRDWLQDFDDQDTEAAMPPMDDFCKLLVFTYVIELPTEFSEISWRIFLYHRGPISSTSSQTKGLADHPLLRHNVIGCLESKRHWACNIFYMGVIHPMTWNLEVKENPCVRAARTLAAYVETLRRSQILPADVDFTTHRFCNLLDTATSLPKIWMVDFPCMREQAVCACRSNKYYGRNFSERAGLEATKIIQQRRLFNCLDCLKSNGVSLQQKSCRVMHFDTAKSA
ncbi:hypothetical protein CCHL11_06106 [Colletotrichum chlorophyti]|uniref:BTB domain-containing protein n=1 Tax=Colletotrichum chlorophyti TaxID=708187 RepID=A0A1Q8RT63_9PEZI|nr:hypothetical protein CCHL11_06106 [Colletotrichum chlorophyti]